MEFEEAYDIYQDKENVDKSQLEIAEKVILQDTYEFLENENFHVGISVIEKLTGIEFN